MLSFSFSTLVFAQKERVLSTLGRFVIGIWFFVVLILTQSYTANLTSMLTIKRTDPTYSTVQELKDYGYNVGYQKGSFVLGMLKGMGLDESKLKIFNSPEEFDELFSKGTSNGGIDAAFEELPYIELLLGKYCGKYMMVGEITQNDGLGFAFPKGSPLGPEMSRKILRIREDGDTQKMKRAWFKSKDSCSDREPFAPSNSLTLSSFWVLFLITGLCAAFAIIVFLIVFLCENKQILNDPSSTPWEKLDDLLKKFYEYDESRMITYFECDPPAACNERNKVVVNGDNNNNNAAAAAESVDIGSSPPPWIENSPFTPREVNSNTARGNSTQLNDYDIDMGYFTPTSESGNSTPRDIQGHREFEER